MRRVFLANSVAYASSPVWLLNSERGQVETWGNYMAPNEMQPMLAVPIMTAAIAGAYIGVGADRTFNLA